MEFFAHVKQMQGAACCELGREAILAPDNSILPRPRRLEKVHRLFYQLIRFLRQEYEGGVRLRSEVGNLTPKLGYSIQLASPKSLSRRPQATKCTWHLAQELQNYPAYVLAVALWEAGRPESNSREGWGFFKFIRGEMLHGFHNR